jgi:hypothetical protein
VAILPKIPTTLPGVKRFDMELDEFLRSRGVIVFSTSSHFSVNRNGLSYLLVESGAYRSLPDWVVSTIRFAIIDPVTKREPPREKVVDALKALAGRNENDPVVVARDDRIQRDTSAMADAGA